MRLQKGMRITRALVTQLLAIPTRDGNVASNQITSRPIIYLAKRSSREHRNDNESVTPFLSSRRSLVGTEISEVRKSERENSGGRDIGGDLRAGNLKGSLPEDREFTTANRGVLASRRISTRESGAVTFSTLVNYPERSRRRARARRHRQWFNKRRARRWWAISTGSRRYNLHLERLRDLSERCYLAMSRPSGFERRGAPRTRLLRAN